MMQLLSVQEVRDPSQACEDQGENSTCHHQSSVHLNVLCVCFLQVPASEQPWASLSWASRQRECAVGCSWDGAARRQSVVVPCRESVVAVVVCAE